MAVCYTQAHTSNFTKVLPKNGMSKDRCDRGVGWDGECRRAGGDARNQFMFAIAIFIFTRKQCMNECVRGHCNLFETMARKKSNQFESRAFPREFSICADC